MRQKITLKKISSKTSQEVRERNKVGAESYSGVMTLAPEIGKSFTFWRDDGYQMWTSTIKKINSDNPNILKLTTLNSEYELHIHA